MKTKDAIELGDVRDLRECLLERDAEISRLRAALRELLEAVRELQNASTGASWQTTTIVSAAWRGLIDPAARAESALRGEKD